MTTKKTFTLIISIFLLPLIAAHSLYYLRFQIPLESSHVGKLLNPSIPVTISLEGNLTKHWSWILISPKQCDNICQQHKNLLKNVHTTLGRHKKLVNLYNRHIHEVTLPGNLQLEENSILAIDPRGHAILYYEPSIDKREVFKDMQHLIKVANLTTHD